MPQQERTPPQTILQVCARALTCARGRVPAEAHLPGHHRAQTLISCLETMTKLLLRSQSGAPQLRPLFVNATQAGASFVVCALNVRQPMLG